MTGGVCGAYDRSDNAPASGTAFVSPTVDQRFTCLEIGFYDGWHGKKLPFHRGVMNQSVSHRVSSEGWLLWPGEINVDKRGNRVKGLAIIFSEEPD
jgi:hypothetical protein